MPSRNEVKTYIENSCYHIYNRGVEKREIFRDEQDYNTFLSYLKNYLLSRDEVKLQLGLLEPELNWSEKDKILKLLRLNNFAEALHLLAFCLMPNHFHLLVQQIPPETIDKFMNSFGTRYVMYFNRKYRRVGPLFQGAYKAVLVETDEQLLHLTRYLHLQALTDPQGHPLQKTQPSSYPNYLGELEQKWVRPERVLAFFKRAKRKGVVDPVSYQGFVEDYAGGVPEQIVELTLD